MADATRPHRNAAGDSSRAVSDPLGLLSLFNGTYTTAAASTTKRDSTTTVGSVRGMDICLMSRATTPVELIVDPSSKNAADSVQDNKVKEHVDDFKRESTRRRWEHARTSMNRKRTHDSATLEPPPPLYKCVVSSKKAPSEVIEPPLSGFADRPKALPARHIDGMLPPPTEHEPLGSIPKWLRHSPDAMAPSQRPEVECSKRVYTYGDPLPLEQPNETDELRFDSCFESGNLLSATRLFRTEGVNKETLPTASRQVHDRIPWVVDHEYDLQMHPDLKTSGNTQWFFFEVTKTRRLERYRFNVTNFAKSDSLYLEGMQPIVYSTKAAATMGIGWRRAGTVLCYSKNPSDVHRQQVCDMLEAVDTGDGDIDDGESTASGSASDDSDDEATSPVAPAQGGASSRQRDSFSKNKKTKGGTHTMSFDLEFEFEDDVVYLAYSHPYTYTDLQHFLNQLMSNPKTQHMCTRRVLCNTIAGNRCDLLTITAPPYIKPKVAATEDDARTNADNNNNKDGESSDTASSSSHERRLLVISARVHPGESNSSWIMQGMLEFLTSIHPAAVVLRKHFVFKVVPMLNPDGVINGNYRCSLSGQDLNRHWHLPCRNDHPTIAAFKHLIQAYQSRDESRVALFCDLHGHSRAQGLFLYGILSTADKQPSQPPKKVRNSVMTLRIAAALAKATLIHAHQMVIRAVPLLEDKMPKDDAAVLAEPRRNAEPVVAPTPKTDALSEIVVPAIDSVSARARVQELELGAEFRTSTDSNPLSSSMKAHGIDMAAFSAIAQEADQLLRETEGLTLDSPALWVAYDGINDEANAKDEIDLSVIVKTPTSARKMASFAR
ncbi:hypothetical protein CTAYLR_004801 [Chrysophaeum taylorii]|uniref:Peptidase M14 domain-containing protein n=1 Tax=Chrysophaeum taylorii TaxID=2483200 RepID=A0AAD7UMT3_9STRA|nr:hypothetical protein CTAYLR_004801 [Chrysophaeum taylorii]